MRFAFDLTETEQEGNGYELARRLKKSATGLTSPNKKTAMRTKSHGSIYLT